MLSRQAAHQFAKTAERFGPRITLIPAIAKYSCFETIQWAYSVPGIPLRAVSGGCHVEAFSDGPGVVPDRHTGSLSAGHAYSSRSSRWTKPVQNSRRIRRQDESGESH